MIDLMSRIPRLAWLNAKTRPQGNGGRKNTSGHAEEHAQANLDNKNLYPGPDGRWYWYPGMTAKVGYVTREQAEIALNEWLNRPRIGQFADHDQAQGDAIDNSVATGERWE